MFGTDGSINDIGQGAVGDCYYLAALSAVAEVDDRFKKVFVNPNKNTAGIYAFNVFVRGIPTIVTIDDRLPYQAAARDLVLAKVGIDGSLWGPLLEKVWYKVNGNVEAINAGFPSEAFSFLTNVPTSSFDIDGSISLNSLWDIIDTADNDDDIMSIWTGGGSDTELCQYNLPCGHAYTLLETKMVTAKNGTEIRLLKIRNPWRVDSEFTGKWRDNSTFWI